MTHPRTDPSRRTLLAAGAATAAGLLLTSARLFARSDQPTITLYCSADTDLAQPIIDGFTKSTGIAVKTVFDTEATKTTGLVNRLLGEKDRPRADVFWSSEPFGTIRLARAGVLDSYTSASAEKQMEPYWDHGWPKGLRGKDRMWYGFGSRARVIAYNKEKCSFDPEYFFCKIGPPGEVALPVGSGRIGMARPQFGTTRGHVAAFVARYGADEFRACLRCLRASGLRLYDGNAAVARALGTGEIHIGLTDSDDVFAGQKQGWPIAMRLEASGTPAVTMTMGGPFQNFGTGHLFLPNTIALVRASPNAPAAGKFIDHILSKDVQRAMAVSESRNIPVDPTLSKELAFWAYGGPTDFPADYENIADHIDDAMKVCEEVLG